MARPPMYQVIEEDLIAEINSGKLPPRSKLPSEHELAKRYAVSRMTVRQALDRLEASKLLVRQRGSGNYVSSQAVQRRTLNRLSSFADDLGTDFRSINTRVLQLELAPAPERVAAVLGIDAGQQVTRYLRARVVDDVPAALQESWIPYSVAPGLARDGIIADSLYRTFQERYRLTLVWAEQEMSAAELTVEQQRQLGTGPGPALLTKRRTYGSNEAILEYAESYTLPDFPLITRIEA